MNEEEGGHVLVLCLPPCLFHFFVFIYYIMLVLSNLLNGQWGVLLYAYAFPRD